MPEIGKNSKYQNKEESDLDYIKMLQEESLYNNSLGLSFIFDVIGKRSDLFGVILFSILWGVFFTIATALEGTFIMEGENTIGWRTDYVWMSVILAITLLFFFSKKLFDRFIQLFSKDLLRSINWKEISQEKYYNIIQDNIDFIKNKTNKSKILLCVIWFFGFLGIIFYGVYLQIYHLPPIDVWHHSPHPIGYTTWLIYTIIILGYLGPMLIWRYVAIMLSIDNIVKEIGAKNGFYIIPMSPDNVGGLSHLGRFSLNVASIPTIPLIIVAIWFMVRETSTLIIVSLPILIIFIIIAFIIPLYSIHKLLESAKEKELQRISSEFNKYYQIVVRKIDEKGPTFTSETNDAVSSMEKLRIMYEACEKMGIWPINPEILVQLSTIILIPTVIAIIPSIL